LAVATIEEVRAYWNGQIHDARITPQPAGTRAFFDDLDRYHFEKLHYLLRLVDFDGYRGRTVLDIGCGAGVDLARFARGGARVTGVDLAASAVDLARTNFAQQGLAGRFEIADGEHLPFPDNAFDLIYAHGVVQYTPDPAQLVGECHRVLTAGGQAIFQVYNRWSWLNALSKLMSVELEHQDAPVLRKFSSRQLRGLMAMFCDVRIVPERYPVVSRLHGGWKGAVYNRLFVGAFNALPRGLVRPFGWHLIAFCRK
jgi:SAM-dependent methyltransferase